MLFPLALNSFCSLFTACRTLLPPPPESLLAFPFHVQFLGITRDRFPTRPPPPWPSGTRTTLCTHLLPPHTPLCGRRAQQLRPWFNPTFLRSCSGLACTTHTPCPHHPPPPVPTISPCPFPNPFPCFVAIYQRFPNNNRSNFQVSHRRLRARRYFFWHVTFSCISDTLVGYQSSRTLLPPPPPRDPGP